MMMPLGFDDTDSSKVGGLADEAALWFVRMHGDDASMHREAFARWLARGALHKSAYDRVARAYRLSDRLRPKRVSRRSTPLKRAVVAAAAALLAVALWRGLPLEQGQSPTAPRTAAFVPPAILGVRETRLADGSMLLSDRSARYQTAFTRQERCIVLASGHIRVSVLPASRPFKVLVGDFELIARGTVFDVVVRDADAGEIAVHMIEGSVAVRHRSSNEAIGLIRPGEGALITSRTSFATRQSPLAPAWLDAIGTFDETSLVDVVAQANRLAGREVIRVAPSIGSRRVSGRFAIGDPERLAKDLAIVAGVALVRGGDAELWLDQR